MSLSYQDWQFADHIVASIGFVVPVSTALDGFLVKVSLGATGRCIQCNCKHGKYACVRLSVLTFGRGFWFAVVTVSEEDDCDEGIQKYYRIQNVRKPPSSPKNETRRRGLPRPVIELSNLDFICL